MVYGSRDNGRERPTAYRTSNDRDRVSSRRTPPIMSTKVSSSRYEDRSSYSNEHKSRRDDGSVSAKGFSNFYRERFGSHSPEDYRNLRISHFDRALSKNDIRNLLEREFKQFMPFEIKIVHNPENDERLSYVNFDRDHCAKTIRRTLIPRLQKVLGRRLALDPTGVIRDQDGKYIPDRFNRAVMAAERDGYPRDRSPHGRRRSSSREYSRSRSRSSSPSNQHQRSFGAQRVTRLPAQRHRDGQDKNPFVNLNQDDTQATRTLYVGNLPGDIRESELRRVFEIYGEVNEIEIKVFSASAAFAFILFSTVEDSVEARRSQHNLPIRPGSTRCQVGYSKTQPSNRLYVGGLGVWAARDLLEAEFDRYGAIDEIEYSPGDSFAYIRFVSLDSASDACSSMKNFELLPGKFITVDFVKDYNNSEKRRKRGQSFSSDEGESDLKRSHVDDRNWSPTVAGYIDSLEDLRDNYACTWKGFVTLKKVDYSLSFHRVFGKEHLLQDYLRDDAGSALKLNITQRVKLDTEFYQEHLELGSRELALIIAASNTPSAERVIHYLREKNAAGLVSLDNCTVHFLPHSIISERLLKFFAPRITVMKPDAGYMLIVLRKNRKEKQKTAAEQAAAKSSAEETRLQPPPPLPSIRVKAEVDDDKLEQMHQARLQKKIKQEALYEQLPPPPAPELDSIVFDDKKSNGNNGKNKIDDVKEELKESSYRHCRHRSKSESDDEEESGSNNGECINSNGDENDVVEDEDDSKSNAEKNSEKSG